MGKKVSYGTRARRRIEQMYGHNSADAIGTGASSHTLVSIEDAKTLVRTIVDITFLPKDSGSSVQGSPSLISWIAQVEPAGVRIVTPTAGTSLVLERPKQVLFSGHDGYVESGSGASDVLHNKSFRYHYDLKGMRKVVPGDEITLVFIAGAPDGYNVTFNYTLIFKE